MDIKQRLTDLRNQLYNDLDTGEVNSFNLIKAIKNHLDELDNFIDNVLPSEGNQVNSENANCAIFDVSQQRELLLAYEKFSDEFYEIDSSKPSAAMIDMFLSQ